VAAPVKTPWAPLIGAGIGLAIAALAGLVTLRAGAPALVIVQDHVVGIAYIVAGTIAWYRRPDNATGLLLLAVGYTWYIPDFESATEPSVAALAFAIRRLVNALSTYLLLAYPSGRLDSWLYRFTAWYIVVQTVLGALPRLLLVDRIPADLHHLDRVASLGCDCVNPFAIASAPALFTRIEVVGGWGAAVAAVLVIGIVIHRLTTATVLKRRILRPVFLAAVVGMAVFSFNVLQPMLDTDPALAGALRWLISLARAALPIAFLVGLLQMKMGQAAVAALVVKLSGERTLGSLQNSIVSALRDPAVKLGYWSPAAETYVDDTGKALALPQRGSGLSVTYVKSSEEPVGAIVHDAVLDDDQALLEAVSAAFALAVDRDRLASSVRAQTADAWQLPRGPVTFLYADVEGSTLLLRRLGDRYAEILGEERRLIRTIVREEGGFEIDSRADEFFGAFPETANPLGAALKIQRRLRDHAWQDGVVVKVRIGLHSGEPQMTDEGYVGLDVHRASRIGSAGHGGQILLSDSANERFKSYLPTDASVKRLGVFRLKGLPGADPIWQLTVPDLPCAFAPLRLADAEQGGG
jgi:class 3 adenylate cyclase